VPTPENEKVLYTVRDAAGLLSISEPTLRKWIRQGKFPRPIKLGDYTAARVRVPRSDLEQFVASRKAAQR
jgi:excisionase family DNA binding protein